MTGLVAIPSLPPPADPPVLAAVDQVLAGDGWWPAVDMAAIRARVRIDTNVTPERLREATLDAVMAVRRELAAWRTAETLDGAAALGEVTPALTVAGEDGRAVLYRRAVASLVAAELKEAMRDSVTSPAGHDRADDLQVTADTHRRDAAWAIRDLQGAPRTTVELI